MEDLLYEDVTGKIRQAAFEVHKYLGNGFLEKVHENALGRARYDSSGSTASSKRP